MFSLGSTLYTALEGRTPFGHHDNAMAVLHRVAAGEVDPPQRTGALTTLLLAMLAADPDDRPTMDEVAGRLLPLGGAVDGAPPVVAATKQLPPVEPDDAVPDDEDLLSAFRHEEPAPTHRDRPPTGAVAASGAPRGRARPARRRRRSPPPRWSASLGAARRGPRHGRSDPVDVHALGPPRSRDDRTLAAPPDAQRTAVLDLPAAPSPTPTPTTRAAAPTAAELGRAVRDYYALVPDDLDAGWERLTDRYRRTTAAAAAPTPSSGVAFERVRVSDVAATAPDTVTATLRYESKNGRVYVERTTYRLVRDDGVLKIDRSEVLSSRSG